MYEWKKCLKEDPIPWLLKSNPWTKYATMTDLLGISSNSTEAKDAKNELVRNPLVANILRETEEWLPKAATRNNDPTLSYFKLRMLSDFGMTVNDFGIEQIIKKAVLHTVDNMFAVKGLGPQTKRQEKEYVKPDPYADIWHVSPCNAPIITYSLLSLGCKNDKLYKAVDALKEKWDSPQGWFCHFFFVESQYKVLQAGCPMAGMMALEVFSYIPELKESKYAKNAFEPILFHRDYGKTLYYFGRSKKFWTMKYPFVWYNALYLADVLSRFDFAKQSHILQECIDWIIASQNESGRFKPTSIYMPYKNWDFGNKKEESPWITFLCCRILKRYFD